MLGRVIPVAPLMNLIEGLAYCMRVACIDVLSRHGNGNGKLLTCIPDVEEPLKKHGLGRHVLALQSQPAFLYQPVADTLQRCKVRLRKRPVVCLDIIMLNVGH